MGDGEFHFCCCIEEADENQNDGQQAGQSRAR